MAKLAQDNDIALITIGRLSGEFLDRTLADFNLTQSELKLIDEASHAFHAVGKKLVVVLNIGGVIETASWKDKADAIICAWQAGQEGGNSVADILSGKVSPSGKLTMTWPVRWADHASSANFPSDGKASDFTFDREEAEEKVNLWDYTNYEEDIYVGYRYFDTFGKEVSFPFGFGLSYTTFSYSDAKAENNGDNIAITLNVKNTGNCDGKEVIQVYAVAPDAQTANKPAKELKAFAKTKTLRPDETTTVRLSINVGDLASFDETNSAWQVSAGEYKILIGTSSRDIEQTLSVSVDAQSRKVDNLLAPKEPIKTLKK